MPTMQFAERLKVQCSAYSASVCCVHILRSICFVAIARPVFSLARVEEYSVVEKPEKRLREASAPCTPSSTSKQPAKRSQCGAQRRLDHWLPPQLDEGLVLLLLVALKMCLCLWLVYR